LKICVTMPAWNEAEGIGGFIEELHASLSIWNPTFIVVDDCSTDTTADVVNSLGSMRSVILSTNEKNAGHGPSTVRGLQLALAESPEVVIALDGDGQFLGPDVSKCLTEFLSSDADIVEGVRKNRHDPLFRRITTHASRLLVWSRCRRLPTDANTPLRVYKPEKLRIMLNRIPDNAMTPNLLISSLSRKLQMNIYEVEVSFIPRRGENEVGTSWGTTRRQVPSKRFAIFCANAAVQWLSFPKPFQED